MLPEYLLLRPTDGEMADAGVIMEGQRAVLPNWGINLAQSGNTGSRGYERLYEALRPPGGGTPALQSQKKS